jgi:hypothetical protein
MNHRSLRVKAANRLAKVFFISGRSMRLLGSLIRNQPAKTTARGATEIIAAAAWRAAPGDSRSTS